MTTYEERIELERKRAACTCDMAALHHEKWARMYRRAYGADNALAAEHTAAARDMRETAKSLREPF
jgi:hypothetical protein